MSIMRNQCRRTTPLDTRMFDGTALKDIGVNTKPGANEGTYSAPEASPLKKLAQRFFENMGQSNKLNLPGDLGSRLDNSIKLEKIAKHEADVQRDIRAIRSRAIRSLGVSDAKDRKAQRQRQREIETLQIQLAHLIKLSIDANRARRSAG